VLNIVLAAFRVGALSNDGGRLQNGAASTGKPIYLSVWRRKASNLGRELWGVARS